MDGAGSDRFPQIHFGERRLEFWHRLLGSDVLWRAALLELVQSGRHQIHREGIQVRLLYLFLIE